MNYKVVFDLAETGYVVDRNMVVTLSSLIVVGVGLLVFERQMNTKNGFNPFTYRVFAGVFLAIPILIGAFVFLITHAEYATLREAIDNRKVGVAEGVVKNFTPVPPSGKGRESFSVNAVRFVYSDNEATNGFHQTTAKGGPMREGQQVRITPYDGTIVKLEFAEE